MIGPHPSRRFADTPPRKAAVVMQTHLRNRLVLNRGRLLSQKTVGFAPLLLEGRQGDHWGRGHAVDNAGAVPVACHHRWPGGACRRAETAVGSRRSRQTVRIPRVTSWE